MPNCPNCGQTTARTADWACPWCGYPLLSKSYKKIPKTYKQLKEETLLKPEPVLEPEPTPEYEPEPIPEPAPEPEPEAIPEPELATEPELVTEPKPEPVPKSKRKPVPESEAIPEPEPTPAAMEITVEELVSAYEADGAAADTKFADKILKVTGVVDRIEVKDTLDIHYINLTNAEKNLLQHLRCIFDKKHGPELNQLTPEQTVTVQGKYDGSIMDIRMSDCVLVR